MREAALPLPDGPAPRPYWYRRWREGGRLRRQYVPRDQVGRVRTAIARHRELYPPLSRLRGTLRELESLANNLEG